VWLLRRLLLEEPQPTSAAAINATNAIAKAAGP
jgi:hypothetical protein